ncbi:MAG: hypothetical protein ACRDD8_16110 [Bacteroidales bacterium]
MILSDSFLEVAVTMWFNSMARLDCVRIRSEEDFLEYVDIYLSILDLRDLFDCSTEEDNESHDRWMCLRNLCNNKIIRMHSKVNYLTQTKYKYLRDEIYNSEE